VRPLPIQCVVVGTSTLLVDGVVRLLRERNVEATTRSSVARPSNASRSSVNTGSPLRTHTFATRSSLDALTIAIGDPTSDFRSAIPPVRKGTPVLLVTSSSPQPGDLGYALLAQVVAIVNPVEGLDALISAIDRAASGFVGLTVTDLLKAASEVTKQPGLSTLNIELTARERELLTLLRNGTSIKVMAALLGVTPKTVESLQRVLYRKLGVHNRIQAVAVATERRLI
jgi:DNA-binding NarL/FixJ family response regulator